MIENALNEQSIKVSNRITTAEMQLSADSNLELRSIKTNPTVTYSADILLLIYYF